MYVIVICPCGRSLGDIYDLYCAMRDDMYAAAYKEIGVEYDPTVVALMPVIEVPMESVLDALQLKLACCRTRILCAVEMKTYL